MEAATILQVAARRGVAAACVLGVSNVAAGAVAQAASGAGGAAMPSSNGHRRLSADELTELGIRIGEAGYAAVSS